MYQLENGGIVTVLLGGFAWLFKIFLLLRTSNKGLQDSSAVFQCFVFFFFSLNLYFILLPLNTAYPDGSLLMQYLL